MNEHFLPLHSNVTSYLIMGYPFAFWENGEIRFISIHTRKICAARRHIRVNEKSLSNILLYEYIKFLHLFNAGLAKV